jgi:hypothetical protein
MTDAPDVEQEVLSPFVDAEKACPDPPADVGERIFARLAASLVLPPSQPEAPPSPQAERSVGDGPSLLRRMVGGFSKRGVTTFLVGAAIGAATYGTVQHVRGKPAASPPVVIAAAPPGSEPPPSASPPTPEPVAGPSRPVATPANRVRETEPSDTRDRGLGAERKLVEMARSALARGYTDRALSALRSHARSHPHGQLAEERDSLMVQALVAKGEFTRAREQATRFHQQHPGSLFGPVVEQAVRSIP